jgi:hypothetical protein
MKRIIGRLPTMLYALGIVGALTSGAGQAFARSVQSDCFYDGYTHLGYCVNPGWDVECTQRCQDISHDPQSVGTCDIPAFYGCCICMM